MKAKYVVLTDDGQLIAEMDNEWQANMLATWHEIWEREQERFDEEVAEIIAYWEENLDSMRGYNRYLAEPIGVQDYSAMECGWIVAPEIEKDEQPTNHHCDIDLTVNSVEPIVAKVAEGYMPKVLPRCRRVKADSTKLPVLPKPELCLVPVRTLARAMAMINSGIQYQLGIGMREDIPGLRRVA